MNVYGKDVEQVITNKGIVIELTRDEAAMLFAVVSGGTGYNEGNNVRILTDELFDAINSVFPEFWSVKGDFSDEVQKYIDHLQPFKVLENSVNLKTLS